MLLLRQMNCPNIHSTFHHCLVHSNYWRTYLHTLFCNHIIKMVISGVARPVGQWAMAHLKGLGPHMNASCWLFWFLPYLPFQDPKLPYHLCERWFRKESIELFLFEDGLEEAQWADVSPLLKNFNAQWRLAADARSASKQRVLVHKRRFD